MPTLCKLDQTKAFILNELGTRIDRCVHKANTVLFKADKIIRCRVIAESHMQIIIT